MRAIAVPLLVLVCAASAPAQRLAEIYVPQDAPTLQLGSV